MEPEEGPADQDQNDTDTEEKEGSCYHSDDEQTKKRKIQTMSLMMNLSVTKKLL